MQRLYMTSYRFREDLDEGDLQDLTKKFEEKVTEMGDKKAKEVMEQ